jgi:hypothetical protein
MKHKIMPDIVKKILTVFAINLLVSLLYYSFVATEIFQRDFFTTETRDLLIRLMLPISLLSSGIFLVVDALVLKFTKRSKVIQVLRAVLFILSLYAANYFFTIYILLVLLLT